jgi:hypothetical protein
MSQSNVVENLHKFFQIQNAFTDSISQTDSSVKFFRILLEMTFQFKHEQTKMLDKSIFSLFSDYKISFLDNQINDAIFMLQKFCEVISINKNRFFMSDVLSIDQKLNFVQTYEEMMIDIMRFEKTYTKFFFFSYFAFCAEENIISNIESKDHRSTLCLTSNEIVLHQ